MGTRRIVSTFGSGSAISGGVIASTSADASTGNAGIVLAVAGIITAIAPLYFRDRSEKRAIESKERQLNDELADFRRRHESAVRRLNALESENERLREQVPLNTVRVAGAEGKIDGALAILQRSGFLSVATPDPDGPPSILVVEDDPDGAKALARLFTSLGFSVSLSPNLADAYGKIREGYDWALLDVMLPDGSGLELLEYIRRQHIPVRVAITSAIVDDEETAARIAELRPDAYFRKPIDLESLIARIRSPSDTP